MSLGRVVPCALTLASVVYVAVAIKCLGCQHPNGEIACESVGTNITCYERLSSETFLRLKKSKGSLEEPRRNTGYQCAEIQIDGAADFMKGCIYANLDICMEFPQAKYCRTCKEDLCNTIRYKNAGAGVEAWGVLVLGWVVVAATVAHF